MVGSTFDITMHLVSFLDDWYYHIEVKLAHEFHRLCDHIFHYRLSSLKKNEN